ncbi:MAG: pyridoxal phosphate-dependent decarboxylase family protein [Vicinamibacteria bacterium]
MPEVPDREDLSPEALASFAHEAVEWMVSYLTGFGAAPIQPEEPVEKIFARFRDSLPEKGASPQQVLDEFRSAVAPFATDLQHPGNLGYIPNSTGIVGIVADLLASTLNQNVSLVRGGASAAAIEAQVVRWLQSLLGHPPEGGGVLTSGGSLANLMGLALAREKAGGANLQFYVSEETHSSIERALRFLGIPQEAMRRVSTDDGFRMSAEALREAIAEDRARGVKPAAVVATAGTIGSGAVDPLVALSDICRREGLWLHVDGAYGALAAAAPSGAWMREGLGRADSLSLDPHKWLFVPIDTSCLLVRDPVAMRRFFNLVPEYLKVSAPEQEFPQPMESTIELSRRFRALRLWMTIKAYGAEALRRRIEEHLALARSLASWIEASPEFELAAPVETSTVAFRYVPPGARSDEDLDRLNEAMFGELTRRPGLFLSRNRLRRRFTLRACITGLRTQEEDVRRLWRACLELAAQGS